MPKKKAVTTQEFKVGDHVAWTSHASGHVTDRTGVIKEVGVIGNPMRSEHGVRTASARHRYAVEVTTKHSRGERKNIFYPSTSQLTLITKPLSKTNAASSPTIN
jgi:hypothetical protein